MTGLPDGLPQISGGGHNPRSGKACVMEYVSLMAGEAWSDRPRCTHPVLSALARQVNDSINNNEIRTRVMLPFIGPLSDTALTGDLPVDTRVMTALTLRMQEAVDGMMPDLSNAIVGELNRRITAVTTGLSVMPYFGERPGWDPMEWCIGNAENAVVYVATALAGITDPEAHAQASASLLRNMLVTEKAARLRFTDADPGEFVVVTDLSVTKPSPQEVKAKFVEHLSTV